MSAVLVDYLATARRVLASPQGVYTLTPHEAVALAACTVRESSGMMPDLPIVAENGGPVISASLAATMALLISKYDALELARSARDAGELSGAPETVDLREDEWAAQAAFDRLFNTLKTRFEKEFPYGQD